MSLQSIKETYWRLAWKWRRRRHPTELILTPHDWMDGIARHLPADKPRLVMVDVGAHDGQMALRFRRRFANLEVHAFEPNPRLFPRLQQNLALVPGSRHNAAVGETGGTIRMIFNASAMTSSPLPRGEMSKRYFDAATRPDHEADVPAMTLDQWFVDSAAPAVDILKIDVQGYEDRVLRGAGRLLDSGVAAVFLEVNFVAFYEGLGLFADVDAILRAHGYRLFNLYNLCTHLPDRQIGSADALYIPDRPAQLHTPPAHAKPLAA